MIEEVGTVIAIDGNKITVETQIKSTCGTCQAQSNCGTGAIARVLTPRSESIVIESDLALSVGSKVRLGIPEEALLTASLWLYIVPIIALIGSAMSFNVLLPLIGLKHELWLIVSTLSFSFASFVWLSRFLKRMEKAEYKPRLLGVLLQPDGLAVNAS